MNEYFGNRQGLPPRFLCRLYSLCQLVSMAVFVFNKQWRRLYYWWGFTLHLKMKALVLRNVGNQ